jgi:hypothetical protein
MRKKKRKNKIKPKNKKIKNRKIEINPEKLKKITFLLSILGIFLIFIISIFIKPLKINGCDLEDIKENTYVEISGEIIVKIDLTDTFKLYILKNDSCKIDVVCNCNLDIERKKVVVRGKVQEYEDKKQILADLIKND